MSQLRITGVDVIPVEVPRTSAFALQRGTTPATSPFTVVRVRTNEGVTGYGEGTTTDRSMASVLTEHFAETVIGCDPFDLTGIHTAMDRLEMMKVERVGHWNPARAAIDIAVHDVQAKWLDIPLSELLGGRQRDEIEVCKNVGLAPPDESATAAATIVAAGYGTLKVRVGPDVDLEAKRLAAIRDASGPAMKVRLDANQAWNPHAAVRAIARLNEHVLEGVEQPCHFADVRGAAHVAASTLVPIIADEGFWTIHDARELLVARAADVLHVYLGKCGGIRPAMNIIALADAFGAPVTIGERIPLGIGLAAHLHVAAILAQSPFAHALAYDINESDLITTPIPARDGRMTVPQGPGLGVEVDEDRLMFYARR
jgi:L-alanine-DL-glutamate epimerase-like enolase superfamily enzyme